MAMEEEKKTILIIKAVHTFRYLLLCFCIVFAEHLTSLNELWSQQSFAYRKHVLLRRQSCVNQECK